mgnify:CR=1 FL=1
MCKLKIENEQQNLPKLYNAINNRDVSGIANNVHFVFFLLLYGVLFNNINLDKLITCLRCENLFHMCLCKDNKFARLLVVDRKAAKYVILYNIANMLHYLIWSSSQLPVAFIKRLFLLEKLWHIQIPYVKKN